MNIIKYIYNLFSIKKNKIIFTINNDHQYDIKINLADQSHDGLIAISTFISILNKGLLLNNILIKLDNIDLSLNKKQIIVNGILSNNQILEDSIPNKDKNIVIRPSLAFYKNVKQK